MNKNIFYLNFNHINGGLSLVCYSALHPISTVIRLREINLTEDLKLRIVNAQTTEISIVCGKCL